ncbi:SurA N-terminal domain-containing protein [Evansella sp. LMS18]|uniref:SurA N-terminal domain-containing protein n=1 Tax=Evansella sp. LMS18 TaxID=2924033 RepID=UPI0020D1DDA3|nr:SurA N-terminal domain-containing protein [Evansella sp. LMS18]UTR12791.1 SurA N-terminal domain-containing protein [Evansella sp. LMS18]
MRKKWALSFALAATVAVSAACGNANDGNDQNNAGEDTNLNTNTQEEAPEENNDEIALEEGEQPDMPEPDLEGVPDVVAEVNGEEITREEFEATYMGQFQQMAMMAQMSGEPIDQDELKEQVAENMIGTELLIQAAESGDYEASEEEMDETLEMIAQQSGMQADEFMAALEEQGMSEEEVMEQLELQVKIDQMIANEAGDVEVTEEELEAYYEDLVAQQEAMAGDTEEEIELPEYEEIRDDLEQQLRAEKENEASQQLVERLRDEADVTVHL